ncbi:uncharacterized protein LOC110972078 isoform X2 [Acanthochromis polyacanthus]|uniref:uncharacterized protein LOC110972078 isoform X2 n=1 Tax=Acanthochromis polyacanthus TaxID=80966 RepID=UPI0022340E20|nr:uncharacterized protein LOC110972078 isoform X2 [Acanthochromis polyacanthus]
MWLFLVTVVLLDLSQATPLPGQRSDLQFLLQDQVYLTISTTPAPPPQKRSSSSSSSSSSASESSQSSEGPQQLRERQNLENTSTEHLQPPSNTSSLWLNELVLLGERVSDRDGDGGNEDGGDNSVESRHRALMLTYHHLLSRLRHRDPGLITGVGGAAGDVGGAREEHLDGEFPNLSDNSMEGGNRLTFDLPGLSSHGDEAALELGL